MGPQEHRYTTIRVLLLAWMSVGDFQPVLAYCPDLSTMCLRSARCGRRAYTLSPTARIVLPELSDPLYT